MTLNDDTVFMESIRRENLIDRHSYSCKSFELMQVLGACICKAQPLFFVFCGKVFCCLLTGQKGAVLGKQG